MRLFHFSEDGDIQRFPPRRVVVPTQRAAGREWLNDPLVWAIDESHQRLYLFPRDCPRIVLWAQESTTASDKATWLGDLELGFEALALAESAWLPKIRAATMFRYEFSPESFESLNDAGMWVSRSEVEPFDVKRLDDLIVELEESRTQLRFVESLQSYRAAWESSVHVSGIRLRNATSWVG